MQQTSNAGNSFSIADMSCLFATLMAVALATGLCFAVGAVSKLLLWKLLPLLPLLGSIALTTIDVLSIAGATWLLFCRLQSHYTSLEAKAVATAFALLSPILIVAAQFVGGMLMFYLRFYGHLSGNLALAIAWMSCIPLVFSLFFVFCGTAIGWVRLLSRTT
jgi:hypothetical protein